jgi:clan AA aspartic protease
MSVTAAPKQRQKGRSMGEVRVTVKLTNASDEVMRQQHRLAERKVRTYNAQALVDTGAVQTVIPADVLKRVGVGIRGQRVAEYADGRRESVGITNPLIIEIMGRDTVEEALVLGDEVLIGQTVLEKLDLHVDCANQRVIPNPAHPDQAVTKVK